MELQVSEPDPFLLLKGLGRIIRKPLEGEQGVELSSQLGSIDSASGPHTNKRHGGEVRNTPTGRDGTDSAFRRQQEKHQQRHTEDSTARGEDEEDRRRKGRRKVRER